MVLTFTGSISVVEGGAADTRTVLAAAIACNLAWGLVDGAMFLITRFAERARSVAALRVIRRREPATAHGVLMAALPAAVAEVLTPFELDVVRERLLRLPDLPDTASLTRDDVAGATAVALLVFLSTFPVVIPFLLTDNVGLALRSSNAIAIVMLFVAGWSLGKYAGRPAWRSGVGMVIVGLVLVAITVALGG